MSIEDGYEGKPGIMQLDPIYSFIVIVFNACPNEISLSIPALKGRMLQLHPIQWASTDNLVKESSYEASSGCFKVPQRTTTVFVEPRDIIQSLASYKSVLRLLSMGAPKLRWTAEEESALKAGITKHGAGKWTTILKDPEFNCILFSRSNVDLKDKWRNMCMIRSGEGSREKALIAFKKSQETPKHDSNQMALSSVVEDSSDEIIDAKPLAMSTEFLHIAAPKRSTAKLETLVLEAITNLKEPKGSNKTTIAMYIEDQYESIPDFNQVLSGKLKGMTEAGKLIKVKHKYRIASSPAFSKGRSSKALPIGGRQVEAFTAYRGDIKHPNKLHNDTDVPRKNVTMTSQEAAEASAQPPPEVKQNYRVATSSAFSEGRCSKVLLTEGRLGESPRVDRGDAKLLNKLQIDADLVRMKAMTSQEAAVAAAQAIAEAEVAAAEAEEAVSRAEDAEADAEKSQFIAEEAYLALKNRNADVMWTGITM